MLDGERLFKCTLLKFAECQQHVNEHILAGRCRDHADYRHSLGKLMAIKDCIEAAKEAYKDMIGELDIKKYRELTNERKPESY